MVNNGHWLPFDKKEIHESTILYNPMIHGPFSIQYFHSKVSCPIYFGFLVTLIINHIYRYAASRKHSERALNQVVCALSIDHIF